RDSTTTTRFSWNNRSHSARPQASVVRPIWRALSTAQIGLERNRLRQSAWYGRSEKSSGTTFPFGLVIRTASLKNRSGSFAQERYWISCSTEIRVSDGTEGSSLDAGVHTLGV